MTNDQKPTLLQKVDAQSGKVGAAILMWFLGIPGFLILLYLLFR